jgi:hypothetical protein
MGSLTEASSVAPGSALITLRMARFGDTCRGWRHHR